MRVSQLLIFNSRASQNLVGRDELTGHAVSLTTTATELGQEKTRPAYLIIYDLIPPSRALAQDGSFELKVVNPRTAKFAIVKSAALLPHARQGKINFLLERRWQLLKLSVALGIQAVVAINFYFVYLMPTSAKV